MPVAKFSAHKEVEVEIPKSYYLSKDDEFNKLKITSVSKEDSKAAPSANKTIPVVGIPKETRSADEKAPLEKQRYMIKQGASVANTIAEVAAQYILNRVKDKKQLSSKDGLNPRYAKTFLVTATNASDRKYNNAEDFIKNLYAASRFQPNLAMAKSACNLFGYEKRPKPAAGSFHPELFEDIRRLNAELGLGLEQVFHSTALIADLDLHTDNYLLNFDISMLEGGNADAAKQLVNMFKQLFDPQTGAILPQKGYEDPKVKREQHYLTIADIIKKLQTLGASVYFHKIDHDSGLYRYADEGRELSFRDHGTAIVGNNFRTQPTNHLAELLVGEQPEKLVLSDVAIKTVKANPIEEQALNSTMALKEFFIAMHEQCRLSISNNSERLRAELILLKSFKQHITSGSKSEVKVERKYPNGLQKEVDDTQLEIINIVVGATLGRGISLHNEYLDFIENSESHNTKEIEDFKRFLESDKNEAIIQKIQFMREKIRSDYDNKKPESFFSTGTRFVQDDIMEIIRKDPINEKLSKNEKITLIDYLSNKDNKNHHLYKTIARYIGEKSMPLYHKSYAKKFREGLAGFGKAAFWFGVGLIGAVAVGAAVTGIGILTGGIAIAAIPAVLPAVAGVFTGVGLGMATMAATTNPATKRWFKKQTPASKLAFGVGIVVLLAAATVLTGGAALALVGAVSVVAGVATLIGVKTAAGVAATTAIVAKSAVGAVGAVEAVGLAKQAISAGKAPKPANYNTIGAALGRAPVVVAKPVAVDDELESKANDELETSRTSLDAGSKTSSETSLGSQCSGQDSDDNNNLSSDDEQGYVFVKPEPAKPSSFKLGRN